MTIPAAFVTPISASAPATTVQPEPPSSMLASTLELTSGLAARDDESFRRFHSEYYPRLLRYLLVVRHGDEQSAQEALQETFVRVARHARRFDDPEVFWSWLTVLARSAASDVSRKHHRYWRLITSYASAWTGLSGEAPDDADERLVALICKDVANLEETERRLIEGKYLQGMSVRQLAEEYSLTEKAVESRLRRARLQLRHQLLDQLKNESET